MLSGKILGGFLLLADQVELLGRLELKEGNLFEGRLIDAFAVGVRNLVRRYQEEPRDLSGEAANQKMVPTAIETRPLAAAPVYREKFAPSPDTEVDEWSAYVKLCREGAAE